MAQQGKQIKVGACECFAYHSVKLVSLANGNWYDIDSNTFFSVVKPSILPCPNSDLLLHKFSSVVCVSIH
jgi:hypothetical protein